MSLRNIQAEHRVYSAGEFAVDDSVPATQPCPICGALESTVIARRSRNGDAMTTVVCLGCGVGRTDPFPSDEQLQRFYEAEYRLAYKGVLTPRKKHVLRAARLAADRLSMLRRYVSAHANVLDLGAGGGEFVWMARAAGLDARGIEPNAGYAAYASQVLGLPMQQGFWQRTVVEPESLQAVTLFHVLEHLPTPVECFTVIRSWLEPGGVLMVEVPHLCAPLGSKRRRFHQAHLLHFCPEPLAAAARHCGFEVLHAATDADQANVLLIAKKTPEEPKLVSQTPADAKSRLPGDCFSPKLADKVLTHWRDISPSSLRMLPHTWRRLSRRFWRMAAEAVTVSGSADGVAILRREQQKLLPAKLSDTIRP
jgi:SAM-dependent methyltransferase